MVPSSSTAVEHRLSRSTRERRPVDPGSAIGLPAGELRGHVTRYIGWDATAIASTNLATPSRSVTVIICFEHDVELTQLQAPPETGRRLRALVGGLHDEPINVRTRSAAVRIEIEPLGARRLLGLPAGELGGLVLDLRDLWGDSVDDLAARLRDAPGWPARFAAIDRYLGGRLRESPLAAPEIAHAWRRLVDAGGRMRIADLAAEVGWSRRHLSSRFTASIGLSPKTAARVLRFEHASAALLQGNRSLADVAVRTGYADQAHQSREWRTLAGTTPTAWLLQERHDPPAQIDFPSLQDDTRRPRR
jgi:AraC-like DNA-binding protein